jgi:hypothetical protein
MGHSAWGLGFLAAIACVLLAAAAAPGRAVDRAKYLLLDSRLVLKRQNAALRVGKVTKHAGNPLFGEDRPWEARMDNVYANVLFDREAKLYKCWYSPFIVDAAHTTTPREQWGRASYGQVRRRLGRSGKSRRVMGVCYAQSSDGLKWTKPRLGIHEFDGKASNLVAIGPHGAGVFMDPREKDPKRRYKMFVKSKGMSVAFSPDGLHWGKPQRCEKIDVAGDTHNNAFWSPELGLYVGITRTWGGRPRVRQVARTQSADFVNWTPAKVVLQGLWPHLQTYAMPVFRYGGVYLGLVMIYRTKADRTHCELTWSPDTRVWHRIDPNTPLIPNSPKKGDYDWGCVYAAACPVFLDKEIRLYYGASDGQHGNWRRSFLALATLRPDGFAGFEPKDDGKPALIHTVPVACNGKRLAISADAKGGSVRVAVRDADGRALGDCKPVTADVTDGVVGWAGGSDLSALKGKSLQLTFELRNAKLYAFRFVD